MVNYIKKTLAILHSGYWVIKKLFYEWSHHSHENVYGITLALGLNYPVSDIEDAVTVCCVSPPSSG